MTPLHTNPAEFPTLDWRFLQNLVGAHSETILDLGANDGGTSALFQILFPKATIHAFEPDPRAIANVSKRLSLGNIDQSRFILYQRAVSDYDGTGSFYPSSGHHPSFSWYDTGYDLSGSLNKPLKNQYPGIPSITFIDPIITPVQTLDTWLKENPHDVIDLIWMDLQGGELRAIKGGTASFQVARYVYLECMDELVYEGQPLIEDISALLSAHRLIAKFLDGNYLYELCAR